ncbi:MAG: PEP-CTERM/exosortase system-associated acyltransferase [Pseudomonadales bacterium]|jgi:N-acyl amino acid synthase of PEP-CTERM/exosortase system
MFSEKTKDSFSKYFRLIYANSPALLSQVYKIRYDVFCTELELEKGCPVDIEKDQFDAYSYHYLLHHKSSNRYAGTIRMVLPPKDEPELPIPIEKFCIDAIDRSIIDISKLPRGSFGEVSRLAVPAVFRKRAGEAGKPYIIPSEKAFCENPLERRHFPHIAIGLYLAVASLAMFKQLDYIFVMIEPRLAKALNRAGLHFEQMGEVVEYHGQRAPFFITPDLLNNHLKPDLKTLYQETFNQIREDMLSSEQLIRSAG